MARHKYIDMAKTPRIKPDGDMIEWSEIRWGTLTRWLRKHREHLIDIYGMDPFNKDGTINKKLMWKLYRDKETLKKLSGNWYMRIWRKIHFYLHVLAK